MMLILVVAAVIRERCKGERIFSSDLFFLLMAVLLPVNRDTT